MAQNSLELRKKLSLCGFYQLAHQVATDYALTSATTARSALMKEYNLTESTFYTMLEFSITHHLVDDDVAQSIRKKILTNQASHGNHGYNSKIKYDKLELDRKRYSAFSKKDIAYIATFYATHLQYSKQETAKIFHFYSFKVLDQLLKKACIECIISDKVFMALRSRALQQPKDVAQTISFFEALAEARAEFKKSSRK